MAEDSWSVSDLALLEQDPQQLQLCADNIRHLKFDDDDFMHHGLFNQC
jgi:hypothetical protein